MKVLKYQFDKDITVNAIGNYECFLIDLTSYIADGKSLIVTVNASVYDTTSSQASNYELGVFVREDSLTISPALISVDGSNIYSSNSEVMFPASNLSFIRSTGPIWSLKQVITNTHINSRKIRYVADVTIIIEE
jgi:hypothetical protein